MKLRIVHSLGAIAFGLALSACSDAGSNSDVTGAEKPAAAAMAASTSTVQDATVGTQVPTAPAVLVTTSAGAPLAGVSVTFAVVAGGGSLQTPVATSNAQGIASAGRWTLGATQGENTVEARVGTLAPVVFAANATPVKPPYAIDVRFIAPVSARQELAVTRAVARWQGVITGDLVDIPVNAPAGSCFTEQPKLNENVDDLIIFVEFVTIDGAGKILGQAGPCYVRSDNSLPVVGHLKLDVADLEMMERSNSMDDVVLHEIGHVLGIGTMWSTRSLISGAGTDDPRFTGSWALDAYRGLGGPDPWVAVENTGGDGTRDGHWRESIFGNELMTGYIGGAVNPMSKVTIASLSDLGYGTNPGAASSFTLNRSAGSIQQGAIDLHKGETRVRPKFKIDRQGRKTNIGL